MNKSLVKRMSAVAPATLAGFAGMSWAFPLSAETADEFDAFSAWVVAIDLSPVEVAMEHGIDPSAVYRNLWVARMKEYREFTRFIQVEQALDMQVQQLAVLRTQMQHYQHQIDEDKKKAESLVSNGYESTAKVVETLYERIDRQTKAYHKLVQLTSQIAKAMTPATPLVQVNNAQINAGHPLGNDPLAKLRQQLGPAGVVDAEVTELP